MARTDARIRGEFTLIELVIVIAILAVLIALLFPAVSSVRRLADAALCMSNARTYAQLMASYTTENKETFPFVRDWGIGVSTSGDRIVGFAVPPSLSVQVRWLSFWSISYLLLGRLDVYPNQRWMYCPRSPQAKQAWTGWQPNLPFLDDASDFGQVPSYLYAEVLIRKPDYMPGKKSWKYATTWPLPPDYALTAYGPVRLSDLRFPSRKGVAYEATRWHSGKYRPQKNAYQQPLDFFAVVGNENHTFSVPVADGSVQQRKMSEYRPGLNAGSVMVDKKLRVLQPPVDITVDGVAGWDW